MRKSGLFIGDTPIKVSKGNIHSGIVNIGNEDFYCIRNYDRMPHFLMSIVSNTNHWMYISSNGGVTAGRVNPDNSLFPYYTDDKVQDSAENTGSKTIIKCIKDGRNYLWEPFTGRYSSVYNIGRNIYKNVPGNKLIFEEENIDLGLTFRYSWMNSDRFGWVRKAEITNNSRKKTEIEILDGIQNILPFGVQRTTQIQFSTLMDAYKKNELIKKSGLGLFRMTSIPVDRAEPSEALRVTTVWTTGLKSPVFLLSSEQLDSFRKGFKLNEETGTRGTRGAFLINASLELAPAKSHDWILVAELKQDSSDVRNLIQNLKNPLKLKKQVLEDVEIGTENLRRIVASGDGIQECSDKLVSGRHFSNVLFNLMRGGIFGDGYRINKSDFILHLNQFNRKLAKQYLPLLKELDKDFEYPALLRKAHESSETEFYRLVLEYLPISFSRRHGDPSRPWNIFSINIRNEDGSPALSYQGNWRDIFQNWEALAFSYPLFTRGMICKFLNASTADGYNPYRISREGFDWEIHDPSDPWSNIGYWGDHQIIYLLRLLEISEKFFPGEMDEWFQRDIFVYANVPYRIKPFKEIVKNPQDSIVFDEDVNKKLLKKAANIGADGKLLTGKDGEIYKVNLAEKLLVSILSKLSNFIPGAGIWMNTQRPDWNDANNALTGWGVSMITLYHLRRHLEFLQKLIQDGSVLKYKVSDEVKTFLDDIENGFDAGKKYLGKGFTDKQRKEISFQLGIAGSTYRQKIYKGFKGKKMIIRKPELLGFIELAQSFLNDTIRLNRRSDGMFHSYNLIRIKDDKIVVRNLYEMLEGQVSVLGSGYLNATEALDLLEALRNSAMYREDQNSYTLYPDRELPLFVDKNIISEKSVRKSSVLKKLINGKHTEIVQQDVEGLVHFNSSFNNVSALKAALNAPGSNISLKKREIQEIVDIYEDVFDHQSFTGRSGTFFKYEGLGSIYWHMVSKLLLSTGEIIQKGIKEGESVRVINKLKKHFHEIQAGIGLHKNPANYGAFTTDPYSHTPSMLGAQQPGMTGQVKEDILNRWIELGICIEKGQISILPALLRKDEFLIPREKGKVRIPKPHLSFTFCGVPFEYVIDENEGISVHYKHGDAMECEGFTIDKEISREIASRLDRILKVRVKISERKLL